MKGVLVVAGALIIIGFSLGAVFSPALSITIGLFVWSFLGWFELRDSIFPAGRRLSERGSISIPFSTTITFFIAGGVLLFGGIIWVVLF